MMRPALLGGALALLAGCAATPPEKDPVQIKLNDLDQRLARIERVVANQSLLELANQLEAARGDVRSLHNDVDQLSNNLAASRKQQHDLYSDLDKRLRALEARGAVAAGGVDGQAGESVGRTANVGVPAAAAVVASPAVGAGAAGADAPAAESGLPVPDGGDRANYQAAFALLKDSQYDQAINAFREFLAAFPDSALADNAQYWLGEAYYVNKNFTSALGAFQGVVDKYPQSRKLPDALLKIGYCDYELKQWDRSKQVLAEVVAKFADTPAGTLAAQRLEKIESEKH